jgi:hypothetical protein
MTRSTAANVASVALLAFAALVSACSKAEAPTAGTAAAQQPERTEEQMIDLGRQHKTAADLYQALREQSKGGRRLVWNDLPDWSGVYTRLGRRFRVRSGQPPGGLPTASSRRAQAKMLKRIQGGRASNGTHLDLRPPGHPRWLTEPFLREFIVTPIRRG